LTASPRFRAVALPWLRLFLQLNQLFVFVGVVLFALLSALNQHASLGIILMCILCVGNILVPFVYLTRRILDRARFPWNWIIFLPIESALAVAAAFGSVLLTHWTRFDTRPFWISFHELGPMIIVVYLVSGIVLFSVRQVQRKLKERNQLLELAVARGSVALEQQEEELGRALQIQQDLLPKTLPQLPNVQIAGAWQPARTVGGDYFDVIRLDDQRLGICIADVAGKGISAALLMANLQASFRAFAVPQASPAAVCAKLNAFICANVAIGKFITLYYAVLDAGNHTLTYENAGHCPPVLLKQTGETETLSGGGAVLGVIPDWAYVDSTVRLAAGDRLLLFTDGVTEAEDRASQEFGAGRIVRAARDADGTALHTQKKIMEEVTKFCGNDFHDDATVLIVAIL
jgi:phosphoserine phosphatase RsbU/P